MAPQTFSSLDVCKETAGVSSSDGRETFCQETTASKRPLYLDLQNATKGHAEVSVVVLTEDSLEGLCEERGVEGVSHDDVAAKRDTSFIAPAQGRRLDAGRR